MALYRFTDRDGTSFVTPDELPTLIRTRRPGPDGMFTVERIVEDPASVHDRARRLADVARAKGLHPSSGGSLS